jgi:CubicO group peptidase (beta-lactamase class C family)
VKFFVSAILFFSLFFVSCDSKKHPIIPQIKSKPNYFIEMSRPEKEWMQSTQSKIDSFFNKYMDSSRFNGQFLVAKNGFIIYEKNLGFAKYSSESKMDGTTPIHVASVSKFITATTVLRLVQEHKIQLDDDVRKYLKNFPYEGITIRMLLNHRSGIPYYAYFSEGIWDKSKTMKNTDVLNLLVDHKIPLNYPPNTHFSYCNTNYALLALIVEKTTKTSFPESAKKLVFEPLGMQNSFIRDLASENKLFKKSAHSYNSKYQEQTDDFLDGIYGDKNLYTTAQDLLLLDKALYGNVFLHSASKDEIFKGYSYEKEGRNNYGLGIRIVEEPDKSKYFFHSGWWHGNTAMFAMLRSDSVTIIALSNRYSKSVFTVNRLASYFGNYPFHFEEE